VQILETDNIQVQVTMDKALKERSHMIIDVDNFYPGSVNPSDLDNILLW